LEIAVMMGVFLHSHPIGIKIVFQGVQNSSQMQNGIVRIPKTAVVLRNIISPMTVRIFAAVVTRMLI
jgi:hypothetical protein